MMQIEPFFDKNTATFTYVVSDETTNRCAIIDSVLDYETESGRTSTQSADKIIDYIKKERLTVEWILETHIHADHLTAAQYLKQQLGGQIGIGDKIIDVLAYWVPFFNTYNDTPLDGNQFDRLFHNEEQIALGNLTIKVIHTPGHTPSCVSYLIEDAVFVGDLIFMPSVGTGRADFPGGSAQTMYHSIQKVFSLPGDTRIFTSHDYPSEGHPPTSVSTVNNQKNTNILAKNPISEKEYIDLRTKRDTGKAVPRLLLPSIQFNLRAGSLGKEENNGTHYLKIPINKI